MFGKRNFIKLIITEKLAKKYAEHYNEKLSDLLKSFGVGYKVKKLSKLEKEIANSKISPIRKFELLDKK